MALPKKIEFQKLKPAYVRAYLFSDVIENLLATFLSGNNFFSDDFEIVINSHRKFVLGFLNRGFLQNKMVLKLLAGLLYHIESYVITAIKQSENSTAHYHEFENGLQVMFNLLKREASFGQYKSYNDCKFLEMFLLRLNLFSEREFLCELKLFPSHK